MVTNLALRALPTTIAPKKAEEGDRCKIALQCTGQYQIMVMQEVLDEWETSPNCVVELTASRRRKRDKTSMQLNVDLIRLIAREVKRVGMGRMPLGGIKVVGYTQMIMENHDSRVSYYAHPSFKGHEWYDWTYLHYSEDDVDDTPVDRYYPSQLLGFISVNDGPTEIVARTSSTSVAWETIEKNFFERFELSDDFSNNYVVCSVCAMVHPLCVIPDFGGGENAYMVVLPKRNWSRYFGDQIQSRKRKASGGNGK